jgi:P27 family predicted phage terminase small subunit
MAEKLKLGLRVDRSAPAHLSESSQQLWHEIVREYGVNDPPGLAILAAGLEARDRAAEARKVLDGEGLTVTGDRGGTKAHPANQIERDNRAAFLQAMKLLNFQPEPAASRKRR